MVNVLRLSCYLVKGVCVQSGRWAVRRVVPFMKGVRVPIEVVGQAFCDKKTWGGKNIRGRGEIRMFAEIERGKANGEEIGFLNWSLRGG